MMNAVRSVRRWPFRVALTAVSVALGAVTVALAISLAQGLQLQRQPFYESHELRRYWEASPTEASGARLVSQGTFVDWKRGALDISLASFTVLDQTVAVGDRSFGVVSALTSPGAFQDVLKLEPALGSWPDVSDYASLVISHSFWVEKCASDPGIVGRTLLVDGIAPLKVAAVLPNYGDFPRGTSLWLQSRVPESVSAERRMTRQLVVVGRVAPSGQAGGLHQLRAISKQLSHEFPRSNAGWTVDSASLEADISGPISGLWPSILTFAVLGCLVAAANTSMFLVGATTERRLETLVCMALGASPNRLWREHLGQVALVGTTGGALAVIGLISTLRIVRQIAPPGMEFVQSMTVDLPFALISVGMAVASALLISSFVLRSQFALNVAEVVRSHGRELAHRTGEPVSLAIVVSVTIAVAVVASAMAYKSSSVATVGRSIPAEGLIAVELQQPYRVTNEVYKHGPGARFVRTTQELFDSMRPDGALAFGTFPPLTRATRSNRVLYLAAAGVRGSQLNTPPTAILRGPFPFQRTAIGGDYFSVLGLRVLEGRSFTRDDALLDAQIDDWTIDRSPGVAIVSAASALRLWPGQNPIGKFLVLAGGDEYASRQVVGVVEDLPEEPTSAAVSQVYVPYWQAPYQTTVFLFRPSNGGVVRVQQALQRSVKETGVHATFLEPTPFKQLIDRQYGPDRFVSAVASGMGLAATGLLVAGAYLFLQRSVRRRRPELALRRTLGATSPDLILAVIRPYVTPVAIGTAVGLIAGVVVGRQLGLSLLSESSIVAALLVLSAMGLVGLGPVVRAAASADLIRPTR